MQDKILKQAKKLAKQKGHDYNVKQQDAGDTLFNLRIASIIGIVDSPAQSVLVRISDKLMRLASLSDPKTVASVKDERVFDTIVDLLNYITYYYLFWLEAKNQK